MKTNRIAKPSFLRDLEIVPPNFGVVILNKERFVEILKESEAITDLALLKTVKGEFLTYRGALL